MTQRECLEIIHAENPKTSVHVTLALWHFGHLDGVRERWSIYTAANGGQCFEGFALDEVYAGYRRSIIAPTPVSEEDWEG